MGVGHSWKVVSLDDWEREIEKVFCWGVMRMGAEGGNNGGGTEEKIRFLSDEGGCDGMVLWMV